MTTADKSAKIAAKLEELNKEYEKILQHKWEVAKQRDQLDEKVQTLTKEHEETVDNLAQAEEAAKSSYQTLSEFRKKNTSGDGEQTEEFQQELIALEKKLRYDELFCADLQSKVAMEETELTKRMQEHHLLQDICAALDEKLTQLADCMKEISEE